MLKKYFFRRVRSFFFIMFIPILIVFIITGGFLVASQQRALDEIGVATLNNFEETLISSTYNMAFQIDAMMSYSNFSYTLKNLLTQTRYEQKELIFYKDLKNFFSTFERANPYVHSIYLYVDGKDRFMTSASGQVASVDTYFDVEWLDYYKSIDRDIKVFAETRWIQPQSYGEPIEIISVFYRNTYLDGVVVINIDKSKYGTLLRSVLTSEYQSIFWINTDGDVVCSADQNYESAKENNALALRLSNAVNTGEIENMQNKWIRVDNHLYYTYAEKSEYIDITQISVIPITYVLSEMSFYAITAILILVLILIIVGAVAYYYTNRSFIYIRECVNIFSAAERGEAINENVSVVEDEYSLILNNIIFLYLKNNQMQIDLLEKQHLYEITELTALQLQINPHFIFNTLQIMDMEIIRNLGTNSAVHKMTQQLSKVVKYAFSNPTEDVLLEKELEYLQAYLDIQKVRFDDRTITYFEIDDSVKMCKVFRLLLQPILENCFEHGRESYEKSLLIKIKVFDRGDYISCSVIDNGKGISKSGLKELKERINSNNSKNIGLTNLNRRLVLRYGEDSALKIHSKENFGMIVSFIIPK